MLKLKLVVNYIEKDYVCLVVRGFYMLLIENWTLLGPLTSELPNKSIIVIVRVALIKFRHYSLTF